MINKRFNAQHNLITSYSLDIKLNVDKFLKNKKPLKSKAINLGNFQFFCIFSIIFKKIVKKQIAIELGCIKDSDWSCETTVQFLTKSVNKQAKCRYMIVETQLDSKSDESLHIPQFIPCTKLNNKKSSDDLNYKKKRR